MKKNPNLDPAGPLRDPQSQTMTDNDDLGYLRRTLRQWQEKQQPTTEHDQDASTEAVP